VASLPAHASGPGVPRPPKGRRVRAASSPYLPDLSWCTVRGLPSPMSLVHLPVSLAEPGPSGSTEPSRLCQGRLPPSPAPPESDCPQLHRLAATRRRRWSLTPARSISASWRTQIPVQLADVDAEGADRADRDRPGDLFQVRGDRIKRPAQLVVVQRERGDAEDLRDRPVAGPVLDVDQRRGGRSAGCRSSLRRPSPP
jgi:hypothetical protein